MADIVTEMNTIYSKWWGHEIRHPIHDAIKKINDQLEEQNEGMVPNDSEQEEDSNG